MDDTRGDELHLQGPHVAAVAVALHRLSLSGLRGFTDPGSVALFWLGTIILLYITQKGTTQSLQVERAKGAVLARGAAAEERSLALGVLRDSDDKKAQPQQKPSASRTQEAQFPLVKECA